MPTLFISYKRGTSAVAALMEKLRDAHYRLWFDRDEIHLGDTDWQARIDQGLELSAAVILNITPAACASEPVRYEVRKARELGKPIFPIILERITDYDAAIRDLGLAEKQHIEDFTDVTRWDEQIQRLLRDLEAQGLMVSPHERRQQRDRNNPKYVMHQKYLKQLAERIGTLNLAQINPEQGQAIYLEDVYVDSPTRLSISLEVRDWQVIDWWISDGKEQGSDPFAGKSQQRFTPHMGPEELGYKRTPFENLIGRFDELIAGYRQFNPDAKPDEKDDWINPGNNGIKENRISLHLNHLAAATNRLVILGAPGSGKSTFVKYLALCLAGSGIDGWMRKASVATLDSWPHGVLTPVYVELRRFVASKHFPADAKTPATADHLWAYIQQELLGEDLRGYAEDLRYDLEHGHAVLILDGLDEIPYPEGRLKDRQQQMIELAQSLNTRFANSRVVVASRPYAYEGWTLPGFSTIAIAAFENKHRAELARRLYLVAGLDETTAQEKAWALDSLLWQIDPELKDRPLFVTLMATLHLKSAAKGLPTRRGALYRASIILLLDRWTQGKTGAPSLVEILGDQSLDDLYKRLAALAYDVHSRYGEQPFGFMFTSEIDESLLYKHLKPLGRKVAAELIPYLSENAGVLVSPGQDDKKDVFHFAHRTFQEYLVGQHLVSLCTEADSFSLIGEHMTSKPDTWRIPCSLAGDVLADTDRRGDLWELLDDLLDNDVPDNITTSDPRWWRVWLASEILQEQEMLSGGKLRRSEKAVCDQLREWAIKAVELGVLPPVERASCGRALGVLGDTRPGVGLRSDGLPEIMWCDVPPGQFLYGIDKQKQIIAQSFKIATYPITYQQFQAFVTSGEYEDGRWWNGMPKVLQSDPTREQYNNPIQNHPRDSVYWYQAVAFTRWVTAKYRGAGLIGENVEIRLPTEHEWEYAARGSDGRVYPYGDRFDQEKANTSETGIGQPSAVGLFPNGVSPYKVHDMSGNIMEWCINNYGNPTVDSSYLVEKSRVARGGSFELNRDSSCVSHREFFDLAPWYPHLGFRVVLGSPIRAI